MSDLTDRIAAEHLLTEAGAGLTCRCGAWATNTHTAHVAEVTETAVRAQIAANFKAIEERVRPAAARERNARLRAMTQREANTWSEAAEIVARGGAR